MIRIGKEYGATGEDAHQRGIERRRAVYNVCRTQPTPEQQKIIERLEKGFHGDWEGRDPYHMMRNAQYMGIELSEEELGPDGLWRPVPTEDASLTLGQKGAIL